MSIEDDSTCGDYQTEPESVAAFDEAAIKTKLFRIYREVDGEILQPRLMLDRSQRDKTVRIDRMLIPTRKLIEAGWDMGAVGVECKKSDVKIGPPLSQILDYSRSAWTLPAEGSHVRIMCLYYFLWPCHGIMGSTASIMAQNRIGGVHIQGNGHYSKLVFKLGDHNIIQHYFNQDQTEVKGKVIGFKTGSR